MNKLNKIFLYGIAMLISIGTMAGSLTNYSDPDKDTVIIKFGNNSQIVVYVDSKEDFNNLTQYDINKILEDLNLQVNELNDSVQVLEIKDETGNKYLKDTSVVYQVEPTDWPEAEDNDNWDDKKYRYYPRPRFNFVLDVGLDNYLENGSFPAGNEPYAVNPIGSWYWNLGPTYKVKLFGPVFMDMGITFALNVIRFDDPRTRLIADDTGVSFIRDTGAVSYSKSKLSTWHIMAKAVPMFAFGSNHRKSWRMWNTVDKGFRLGAGAYAGYRIWSRTKYVYDDGNGKRKDKKTGNHLLSNVRYGIRGQVGFRGLDLFIEYDLNEMFQENQGAPPLQRIQFGISF